MTPRLQLPARYTKPLTDDFETDGDRLIKLIEAVWVSPENDGTIELDEWQKWLLRAILEKYPADHPQNPGEYRYRQVCVSIPRQVGKSVLGATLGLFGLLLHESGPQVVSLASNVDQAEIIYSRVLYVIRNNPALEKRFRRATETRGIVTQDGGGKYSVKPAKESSMQGYPISLCLFDELHIAKKGLWSAALLGTNSRKHGMVIGITTAGDEESETLIDLYKVGERAIAGDPELERFGFFCWEAPQGAKVNDPEAIAIANPAVACGRIPIDRVLASVATMPEFEARRYVLNQFVSGSVSSWLPGEMFVKTAKGGVTSRDSLVFAVDKTINYSHATITAAARNGDVIETEIVATFVEPSEDLLFEELTRLYTKHGAVAIALDDRAMPNLGKRLKLGGYKTWQLYSREVSAACQTAYALFAQNKISHPNDPLLQMQMPRGIAKHSGDTWVISRRDSSGDIDALLATVWAVYVTSVQNTSNIQVF